LLTAPISHIKVSNCLIHAAAQRRIVVPQQHLVNLIGMLSLKSPSLLLLYVPYLHSRILAPTDNYSIPTLKRRNIAAMSIQIIILISVLPRHIMNNFHIVNIQISHVNLHSTIFFNEGGESLLVGVEGAPDLIVSRALQKSTAGR
jgi:hypothetical protein